MLFDRSGCSTATPLSITATRTLSSAAPIPRAWTSSRADCHAREAAEGRRGRLIRLARAPLDLVLPDNSRDLGPRKSASRAREAGFRRSSTAESGPRQWSSLVSPGLVVLEVVPRRRQVVADLAVGVHDAKVEHQLLVGVLLLVQVADDAVDIPVEAPAVQQYAHLAAGFEPVGALPLLGRLVLAGAETLRSPKGDQSSASIAENLHVRVEIERPPAVAGELWNVEAAEGEARTAAVLRVSAPASEGRSIGMKRIWTTGVLSESSSSTRAATI